MARVGVGPGQVKPVPGEELRVGETLTAMREDLAGFMGCIVKVADDLEEGAPHETVKVTILGTQADGSEVAAGEELSVSELEAARDDAALAARADTGFRDLPRNLDCGDNSDSLVSRQQSQVFAAGRRTRSSGM